MTKTISVTAAKYIDVRDKEQLYVVMTGENGKVVINVGQKTFDAVVKLIGEVKETINSKLELANENQANLENQINTQKRGTMKGAKPE